jgi:hypothetical protein
MSQVCCCLCKGTGYGPAVRLGLNYTSVRPISETPSPSTVAVTLRAGVFVAWQGYGYGLPGV